MRVDAVPLPGATISDMTGVSSLSVPDMADSLPVNHSLLDTVSVPAAADAWDAVASGSLASLEPSAAWPVVVASVPGMGYVADAGYSAVVTLYGTSATPLQTPFAQGNNPVLLPAFTCEVIVGTGVVFGPGAAADAVPLARSWQLPNYACATVSASQPAAANQVSAAAAPAAQPAVEPGNGSATNPNTVTRALVQERPQLGDPFLTTDPRNTDMLDKAIEDWRRATGHPSPPPLPKPWHDPHPVPKAHALPVGLRGSNIATRLDKDGLPTVMDNFNVDPMRAEMAVALANVASEALAEKQAAEKRIPELRRDASALYSDAKSLQAAGLLYSAEKRKKEADSLMAECDQLKTALPVLDRVVADAKVVWVKYQLDDVTVGLGTDSSGLIMWEYVKGMNNLFQANNAGKFFPKDTTPNSAWMLFDMVTWAIPIFKSLSTAEKVGAEAAGAVLEGEVAAARRMLTILQETCFAAGTPVLTPAGEKLIEDFKPGDKILSRPEDSPDAPVRTSVVEKVFTLSGSTLELRVGGQTLTTTEKHPFFVAGKGWVPACELQRGDLLVGHDGRETAIGSVELTHRHETVYNLRVAIDHTYFVGRATWGFSAWVHNAYTFKQIGADAFQIFDESGKLVTTVKTLKLAKAIVEGEEVLAVLREARPSLKIAFKAGLNRRDFLRKVKALQDLAKEGKLVKAANPVARNELLGRQYKDRLIKRAYEMFGMSDPAKFNSLRSKILSMQADHIHELQLSGLDDASNLWLLDRDVNREIGLQIWQQIRNLPDGTLINDIEIEGF